MKEILQKWLFKCLGLSIPMENLGQEMRDGVLFAKLLKFYDVVNDKSIQHILPSDNIMTCQNNLQQLNVWFQLLGIKVGNDIFLNIANSKTLACLHILYELYLALNNKEKLHFINTEKHLMLLKQQSKIPVEIHLISEPCKYSGQERLLQNDETNMEHNRLNFYVKNQKESYRKNAKKGVPEIKNKSFAEQEKIQTDLEKMRNDDISFVRNELKFSNLPISKSKKDNVLKAIDIQSLTEKKNRNKKLQDRIASTLRGITKDCENFIMNNIWKVIENKEKEKLRIQISHNLLQQSDYEKYLSTNKFKKEFKEKCNAEKFFETKQKIYGDIKNLVFFSSCKTSEEEINSQIEIIRKIDNHRKLYAEKLKARYRKHYTLCWNVVSDIVELAIKISHFGKESVSNDTWSEWKQMFISELPILEINRSEDKELVRVSVIERDTAWQHSNGYNFEEYLYLIGDWLEHSGSDVIFDENNILGNVIHRLFDVKNPPPSIQKSADIPKYSVSAILNGINDESDLIKLKSLLIKSRICLVDLKSAINFCIQHYKNEAGIEEEISPKNKDKKDKVTPKAKKSKQKGSKEKKVVSEKKNDKIDKEIQTTSSLLSITEDKELTMTAKIGMKLYNLETFDDIPIPLTVEVFIEFLRCQPHMKGWVIVNFPNTRKEAYFAEKTLSGKKFPKKFQQMYSTKRTDDLLNTYETRNTWDEYEANYSKLVQFPSDESENFITYFTSFILVTKGERMDQLHNEFPKNRSSEPDLAVLSEQNSEDNEIMSLAAIYKEQGILHNFVYETMDLNTLKRLGRLIMKDLHFGEDVPSVELFGEETLQLFTQATEPKNKKSPKKAKDVNPAAIYEILIQNTRFDDKDEIEIDADEKIQRDSKLIIKPGDNDWVYSKFYIPEDKAICLASLWEDMEVKYITKTTEILNRIKYSKNLISPYILYISKEITQHFEEHKECQNIIKHFLDHFNSIPTMERFEKQSQDELFSAILNTEIKLWQISSKITNRAEDKLNFLINQNWATEEMVEIVNNFTPFLLTEVNRCISTIYILHNYYSLMSGENTIEFSLNLSLPPVQLLDGSEEKEKLKLTILKLLLDESNINVKNPLHDILDNIVKQLQTELNKLKSNIITVIENHKEYIFKQIEEYKEKVKADKKKEKHKKSQTNEDHSTIPSLEEEEYNDIKKMFLEWSYAVKNECDRTNCRIKIITRKTHKDIENLESNLTNVFHNLKKKIKADYLRHNEYIDQICKVFQKTVTDNIPMLTMELLDNSFYYQPYFIGTPAEAESMSLEKKISSQCFTINQLKIITDRFKFISPTGIISKRALVYIIEDLIFCRKEKESVQLFPKIWSEMNSFEFEKLFATVFGLSDLVDWKDFVIYCLELRFPDMEDIINYKIQFNSCDTDNVGSISYIDYMRIKFWFEQSMEDDGSDRIQSTKQFLFSLFQINDKVMDYTAFILAFCKDFNENIGFGKGLAYFLGSCVIVSHRDLYLEDVLTDYNEERNNIVKEILNQIIFDVVNIFSGLKIEEISESIKKKDKKKADLSNTMKSSNASELQTDNSKEKVLNYINYENVFPKRTSEFKKSAIKRDLSESITVEYDKTTQTVSLTELLTDEYIERNKGLQWTSKVPKSVVNSLLEATVYNILSSKSFEKEIEDIVWRLKSTLAVSEDEFVYLPWLMNQNVIQDLFLYIYRFKLFSFPSIINPILQHSCA